MSGDTGSPLAAILGGIVGFIALIGLFALIFYRRREKKRERKAAMGGDDGEEGVYGEGEDPSMQEAPRTAFRHESFMALVKDAAQGFYAPTASSDPSPVLGSTSTAPEHAGTSIAAGTGAAHANAGGPLARQSSALSRGTLTSTGTLDYLDAATTASPASPPHAHAVGMS
ncbi:hypothetical protein BG000_010596 [Podila horticola]|nr:hypothetical protein BG000_010596 [Podila horticola]